MIPAAVASDVLGVASGVVAAIGTGCYVRGWLRRDALPSRVSWTWWTLVSAAVTGALALHHAPWPLLVMPAESTAGCGLILVLSLVRGANGFDAAARFMTVGVITAVPVWLIWPHATGAVALSAAVEVAGDVPTISGAWRNPRAEPASSWACVAISGVLSLGAATLTPGGQLAGYLLPAAWVLGGVSIPAAAMLGSWARRVTGRRESVIAGCFLALAPVPLAAMALVGFEAITGISVPGLPTVASSAAAKPPRLIVLPSQTRRERGPAHTRRPVLAALPPSPPSHSARPSTPRTRKPLPARPSPPRRSPTRTPDPAPTSTSPYPSPTTPTPSPTPTGGPSPSPSSTATPSPTPSAIPTYPSPTATATPTPTYAG
jgi:hypothetical protein